MQFIGNCQVGFDVGKLYVELEHEDPLNTKIELRLPNSTYRSTLIEEIVSNNFTWHDAISVVAEYINNNL